MAMLNAPTMECDRVNLRRSVPVQKRQQIFETVPVRHRGTSFRVGETFLMQLHPSRPEPRLSTFERCWLGGAMGRVRSPWRSGQATRAIYSRSAPPDQSARSARRARPLKRTALIAKPMNGINAPQRPDCVADDAVSCELVSAPNSLLTGKLTGNFADSGSLQRFWRSVSERIQ